MERTIVAGRTRQWLAGTWIVAVVAGVSPAMVSANPLACFCIENEAADEFLFNCRKATPRGSAVEQARCVDAQTGLRDTATIKLGGSWQRVEAGSGACTPCVGSRVEHGVIPREDSNDEAPAAEGEPADS